MTTVPTHRTNLPTSEARRTVGAHGLISDFCLRCSRAVPGRTARFTTRQEIESESHVRRSVSSTLSAFVGGEI